MTVDRSHVLATPGIDRHGAYVVLSRHRDGVDMHYGRDDFSDESRLVRTLARERVKDMATDYQPAREPMAEPRRAFAERRGITLREHVTQIAREVAAPIGAIDQLTVVSTDGAGALPKQVTDNVVQTLSMLKTTTGIDLEGLIKKSVEGAVGGASGQDQAPAVSG